MLDRPGSRSHQPGYGLEQAAHRDFAPRSDIEDLPGGVVLGDADETAASVVDICEVAGRGQIAHTHLVRSGRDLGDDRGYDRAGGLARAEGVERPGDRDRQPKRIEKAHCDRVGADFTRAVRRLRSERMRLVNRDIPGAAVYLARRSLNELFAFVRLSCLADIQRPFDICIYITIRRTIRVWDGNKSCQVKYNIDLLEQIVAKVRFADVAGDDPDNIAGAGNVFEPAPMIEGIVLGERDHPRAHLNEMLNQGGADEPIRAGNQDSPIA